MAAPYYTKDTTDALLNGLRQEWRSDVAQMETRLTPRVETGLGELKMEISGLRSELRVWVKVMSVVLALLATLAGGISVKVFAMPATGPPPPLQAIVRDAHAPRWCRFGPSLATFSLAVTIARRKRPGGRQGQTAPHLPALRKIRKIDSARAVSTVAGDGNSRLLDGTGTAASFYSPAAMILGQGGNLYLCETLVSRIRRVTAGSYATAILVGDAGAGFADGAPAMAQLSGPAGIGSDSSGNLFVADTKNNRIRKIDSAGNVTTIAGSTKGWADGQGGSGRFSGPKGIFIVEGGLAGYATDPGNAMIRKIITTGGGASWDVITVAGTGIPGYADGATASATFTAPEAIAVDPADRVWIGDGNFLRVLDPSSGTVRTVLGTADRSVTLASGATISFVPTAIGFPPRSAANNALLFVADAINHRVLKLDTSDY